LMQSPVILTNCSARTFGSPTAQLGAAGDSILDEASFKGNKHRNVTSIVYLAISVRVKELAARCDAAGYSTR
jgi:hypothetical protein